MSEPEWLSRLDAHGWLAAAQVELDACREHAARRRTAVTHARRAGGMALNAVLRAWAAHDAELQPEVPWGRSYLGHLQAVARGVVGPLDPSARVLAEAILATGIAPPPLVVLGGRHAEIDALHEHTLALVRACADTVARLAL